MRRRRWQCPDLLLLAVPAPDDLERIVVEPARRAGYELDDPALASEMVDAVATQPGALALLSFTAAELWKLRDRHFHQLTRKAYAAIGGVAGALAKHAEATLAELSSEDQRLVRIAFRHLVTVDGTRQVLTVDELHQLLDAKPRAHAVVDRLIAARLLVASEDAGGVARIEIIHETLLAAWPRLVEWRREDAEGARLRDQLRVAARQWDARDRPRGLLWRDDALAEYRIWRARHPGMMTDVEEAFGRASLDDEARRHRIRRTLLASTFLALGVIAIVLYQLRSRATDESARAIEASERAEEQKTVAETERARAEARENEMRVVNARSTVETDPTTTIGWLKNYPLTGPSWDQVRELALEAQMRGIAKHVIVGDEPVWLGFAGDQRLVSAGGHTVQTWDRRTGQLIGELSHSVRLVDDFPSSIALWPDGSKIAFTDIADQIYVASLPSGTPALITSERGAFITISPDGRYLVIAARKLQVYDLTSKTLRSFEGHVGSINAATFTVAGSHLLTAGEDGTLRSWDLERGTGHVEVTEGSAINEVLALRDGVVYTTATDTYLKTTTTIALHHSTEPMTPRPTPDGGLIAVNQQSLRSWTATGTERVVPSALGGRVIGWSANVPVFVLAGATGPRVLDLQDGTVEPLLGHRTARVGAASPDGSAIAVLGGDGRIRIWERVRSRAWTLLGHTAEINDIAFSPDGRSVITGSMDRSVRVWQLGGGSRALTGHDNGIYQVASAVDGNHIAVSTWGSEARIWDLATGSSRRFEHDVAANQMMLAGEHFYVANERGVTAWNLKAGTSTLFAQPDPMALAMSPDRTTIAAAGLDGRIVLWNLATGSSRVLGRQEGAVGDLRYLDDGVLISRTARTATRHLVTVWSPDGTSRILYESPLPFRTIASSRMLVAVGGEGNAIFVFDLRANTTRVLRGHDKLVRALALSPDGKLLVSGSDDATMRLWVIESGHSRLLHRFGESAQTVAFSPDGKWAAGASTDHTAWAGELQVDRCLPIDPAALAERFEQFTSVTIDRARLLQGRTDGATTKRSR